MVSANLILAIVLLMGIGMGAFLSPLLTALKRAGKFPVIKVNPKTMSLAIEYLPATAGFLEVKDGGPNGDASVPLEGEMAYQMGSRKAFLVDTAAMLPFRLDEGRARRIDGRRMYAIRHSTKLRKISEDNSDDRATLAKFAIIALVLVMVGIGIAIFMLSKLLKRGGEVVQDAGVA